MTQNTHQTHKKNNDYTPRMNFFLSLYFQLSYPIQYKIILNQFPLHIFEPGNRKKVYRKSDNNKSQELLSNHCALFYTNFSSLKDIE